MKSYSGLSDGCQCICPGECEATLKPTADMLRKHGIRPILNFAAEDDVSTSTAHSESAQVECADALAERANDRNLQPFLKSVEDAGNREGKGFVAAKVGAPQQADHHLKHRTQAVSLRLFWTILI